MIYRGKIQDGKFRPYDEVLFLDAVKSLEGKSVEVEIRTGKSTRSTRMNKYYWGVVIKCISSETGYTDEETHEYLKTKFLGYKVVTIAGERHPILNSSATLSTDDFQNYLAEIVRWAGEFLNLTIPQPNE